MFLTLITTVVLELREFDLYQISESEKLVFLKKISTSSGR